MAVDGHAILERLASLQIATWNYNTQADSVRHMGPMAQDSVSANGWRGSRTAGEFSRPSVREISTDLADASAWRPKFCPIGSHATRRVDYRKVKESEYRS